MKRRDVLQRIKKAAKARGMTFELARQGGRHEVYDLDGLMIPVPRHAEIDNQLAETIWKECEPKLGKRWWK